MECVETIIDERELHPDTIPPTHRTECNVSDLNNRLDTMEASIVNLTKALAQVIAQQDSSNETNNAVIQKLDQILINNRKSDKTVEKTFLEHQTKELEKQNNNLQRQIKELDQASKNEIRKVKEDLGTENTKLKKELADVREHKIRLEIENEKYSEHINQFEQNNNELRASMDARLNDKQKIIESLHDRLTHNANADNGQPWETVTRKRNPGSAPYSDVLKSTWVPRSGHSAAPTFTHTATAMDASMTAPTFTHTATAMDAPMAAPMTAPKGTPMTTPPGTPTASYPGSIENTNHPYHTRRV